ncbi:hypothetical protein EVAR_9708_1 [Eumeta japonica]|uniref:Uncharacterized protein n=1 Tax=Eumeta variegata TaxID=151549 RepID=A0A4C1YZ45_EUMVA|nr:hypothetical protein EVAR_9708_1 [Eumeta japonica]
MQLNYKVYVVVLTVYAADFLRGKRRNEPAESRWPPIPIDTHNPRGAIRALLIPIGIEYLIEGCLVLKGEYVDGRGVGAGSILEARDDGIDIKEEKIHSMSIQEKLRAAASLQWKKAHYYEKGIMEDQANIENTNSNNTLEMDLKQKINNYMDTENKTERVLPLCDNLEESLDIGTKNESRASSSPLNDLIVDDFESKEQDNLNKVTEVKDLPEDEHNIPNEIPETKELGQIDQDENDKEYKKFEEIVEDLVKMSEVPFLNANIDVKDHNNASTIVDVTPLEIEDLTEIELEGMEDEILSASSEGRATRWEALADIAAELPPSLAVDPLTGQIYAVSK